MAEPLEQGIGSADPCPSGAGKEVAAWNAPRMGTLIFTHMPMIGRVEPGLSALGQFPHDRCPFGPGPGCHEQASFSLGPVLHQACCSRSFVNTGAPMPCGMAATSPTQVIMSRWLKGR